MERQNAKVSNIDYKDIEMPEVLYKYRDWNNIYHKTIITERKVYYAKPSDFEDEFDCKIPVRYDLLNDFQIYSFYLQDSIDKHPDRSFGEHGQYALGYSENSPVKDENERNRHAHMSQHYFNERLGVLSLTKRKDNVEMWRKYAANHKGFAIGFNPRILFNHLRAGGGEVIYYSNLPLIYPYPIHDYDTQIGMQVYSKLKRWEWEDEYRSHTFSFKPLLDKGRIFVIQPEAYLEIIFGAKMSEEEIADLINNIPLEIKEIKLQKAVLMDDGRIQVYNF